MRQNGQAVQQRFTIERDHLDGLAIFLAVAEARGFRAAAGKLGLTPSAVSQGVRRLEERLGASLFARTTRSVALTEAGERLLTHTRPAVEMLKEGFDAASGLGASIRGRLRINAPRAALPLLARRLLPEFLDLHPEVELELVGEDRIVDIVALGFDAGIRFGHLVEADMIATRLTGPDRHVVVATPAFVEQHGRPAHPDELHRFRCVGYLRDGAIEPWRFVAGRERVSVRVKGALAANDVDACLCAALRGAGYFWLARSLVRERLARGELVSVLDDFALTIPGLSLYYPRRSQSLPKLRAFVELAKKRMRSAPGS